MKNRIRRFISLALIMGFASALLSSCGSVKSGSTGELVPMMHEDALRTTYEVFVWSFRDSDGDRTGDLRGVREELDYIGPGEGGSGLGCDTIWLMPIFPSPTYHKYDVTDYTAIDPAYGSMEDFDELLSACHARGMKLLLDLPLNHTSTEHPWFRAAVDYLTNLPEGADPAEADCPYVWYYHFSRERYDGYAEIPEGGWFYEARFWEGMPDLAIEHDSVKSEIRDVLAFWLGKGVDGFRLDAVTSYFTDDVNANVDFLSWLDGTVSELKNDAYLVGEAWTGQDLYARYYESGIDSLFDFAFAGQDGYIAQAVKGSLKASRFAALLEEEEALYAAANPDYINAPFYTNHDMARSTGYYAYDDGTMTKLAYGTNLMISGNAFLYYGEELGMKGSGRDENKRAPMYWSTDANADGMCAGPPEIELPEHKFGSFEEQAADPDSVYSYMKHAILIRNSFPAISRGKTRAVSRLCTDEIAAVLKTLPEDAETGDTASESGSSSDTDSSASAAQEVLLLINFSDKEQTVEIPERMPGSLAASLCTSSDAAAVLSGRTLTLPGHGIVVLK